MKRIRNTAMAVILAFSMILLAGCKSEFTMTENTEKRMTISAQNADKKDFFMVGSLEVEEGEQIMITSDLSKGSVRVEILGNPDSGDVNEVPELNGEAIMTADLKVGESVSDTVPAGSYMMKATCLEKATGTVTIEVKPAS